MKTLFIVFVIYLFIYNGNAKEVRLNEISLFNYSKYRFELTSKNSIDVDKLILKYGEQKYEYIINEHLVFCKGSEDGCNNTGVFIEKFDFYPNELILLRAIKGAHSKILYIFDPKLQKEKPLKIITGAYFIKIEEKKNYLEIKYDKYCDKEEPCEVVERFE